MAYEALILGFLLGGLASAIVLRIVRYKIKKGGESYGKVRYPGETVGRTDAGYGINAIRDETSYPKVTEHDFSSSTDVRGGSMETSVPTTAESAAAEDRVSIEKLRSIIRQKGGN